MICLSCTDAEYEAEKCNKSNRKPVCHSIKDFPHAQHRASFTIRGDLLFHHHGGYHEAEKEYTIGGLVVEAKSLTSRTGSQFGIIKIEDYTGSAEIRLFGQDYINYNKYGIKGNAIIVTYTYKKGKYNDKVYMTISGIQSLEEVQGTAISGITLDVAEKDLEGQAFMTLLDENIVNDGECAKPFSINLMNEKHSLPFTMISGRRLNLTKNLILQLEDLGIKYTVNK